MRTLLLIVLVIIFGQTYAFAQSPYTSMSIDQKNRAFWNAAKAGNVTALKQLLDEGVRPDAVLDGFQAIHFAAEKGNLEIIDTLLAAGVSAKAEGSGRLQPILFAAMSGNVAVVQALLKAGATLTPPNDGNFSPLHVATGDGHLQMVTFLLQHGVNVDVTAKEDGAQPSHLAAARGHLEILQLLIKSGANVNIRRRDSRQPLHLAAEHGHVAVVKLLLDSGADLNGRDEDRRQPLHFAARNGHLEVLKLLIASGAEVVTPQKDGQQAVHLAASAGSVEMLQLLLKSGAKVSATDTAGLQPVTYAFRSGQLPALKFLITAGATAPDVSDTRSFVDAAKIGDLQSLKTFIALGVDVNRLSPRSWQGSALATAIAHGHVDAAQLLLASGANIELPDDDGNRPIIHAKSADTLEFLLKSGAVADSTNRVGLTALHNAVRGNLEMVKLLVAAGARIDTFTQWGKQPLHSAVDAGASEVVGYLLSIGAKTDVKTPEGKTPLDLSIANKYTGITRLLTLHNTVSATSPDEKNRLLFSAVQENDVASAVYLLQHGAQVSSQSERMLHLAIDAQNNKMLKVLLAAGASFDATAAGKVLGSRLLCRSIEKYKSLELVQTLLAAGADLAVPCSSADLPVHYAARLSNSAILELVLAAGADPHALDEWHRQPSHYAAAYAETSNTLQSLQRAGADLFAKDVYGSQPIHKAAATENLPVLQFLLKAGADPNAQNKRGERPIHSAFGLFSESNTSVIQELLLAGADAQAKDELGMTPLMTADKYNKSPTAIAALKAHSPGAAAEHAWLQERQKRYPSILKLLLSPEKKLDFHCDTLATGFPERYDNLDDPSRASNNWRITETIATNFAVCIRSFADRMSKVTEETLIPETAFMLPDEKTKLAVSLKRSFDNIKERITRKDAEIASELRLVASSRDRMHSAMNAELRGAMETRQWINELTQSLNDLAARMFPPPPPRPNYSYEYYGSSDTEESSSTKETPKTTPTDASGATPSTTGHNASPSTRRKTLVQEGFNTTAVVGSTGELACKISYENTKKIAEKWVSERKYNGSVPVNGIITDFRQRECTMMGGDPLYRRVILDITYEIDEINNN